MLLKVILLVTLSLHFVTIYISLYCATSLHPKYSQY